MPSIKFDDDMFTNIMELVPALVVISLTGTLIFSYVSAEKTDDPHPFRDWATNLVALYVGKSISDQAQHQAAKNQKQLHTHDYPETSTPYREAERGLPEESAQETPRQRARRAIPRRKRPD